MIKGEFLIKSEQEMFELGERIANELALGDVLCLSGELGAGKTTLTKGIGAGLGIESNISSPSFNIIKTYVANNIILNHIDAYRLSDSQEAIMAGILDAMNESCICIIEWGEIIMEILPENTIFLRIEYIKDDMRRVII